MANYIKWNGKKSTGYGLTIEKYPNIILPKQKFDSEDIPGKNGKVFFYEDAWENYDQQYDVYAKKTDDDSLHEIWRNISEWLYADNTATPTVDDYINLTLNGYHQFEDSYDPDIIRLATLTEETEVENFSNNFGRSTLTFNFRPEKFMEYAFTAFNLESYDNTSGYTTYMPNPYSRPAKPLIIVYLLSGLTWTLTVSNEDVGESAVLTFNSVDTSGYYYIDSETQNVFTEDLANKNSLISLDSEFPKLWDGLNTIICANDENYYYDVALKLYPRWFCI